MEEIIYVGNCRDYNKIQPAIKQAKNNAIIVIDPGIYKENVVINKLVHLRGYTDNPEKGEVVIDGGNNIPIVFNYLPDKKETIYVEGLQVIRNEKSCQKLCLIANSNSYLSFVLNRCRILAKSNQYPISISNGVYTDSVIIENCYLQRGEAHLSRFNAVRNKYSAIIKTELNDAFTSILSKDRPNIINVVGSPTFGYGPTYGSYYKPITYDRIVYEEIISEEEIHEPELSLSLWQKIKRIIGLN